MRAPLRAPVRWVLALVVVAAAVPAAWRVLQAPAAPVAFAAMNAPAEAAAPAGAAPGAGSGSGSPPGSVPVWRSASQQPGAAVHAASGVKLRDGRIRAVWFSGSREGASDVSIRTAVFEPRTGQWSAESTALSRPALAAASARFIKKLGNPVLARAADGRLHLYVVAVSLGGWAGSSITRLVSDDEGERWHSPRRLVSSPFLNLGTLVKGVPVAYADGRVGLPAYHELIERFPEWLVLGADGRVQSRVRPPASVNNLQPVVRVLDERRAEMWMRHASAGTPARITRSRSEDAGLSWSPVQATDWPNPNAAVTVLARRGGDSLLVFNDTEAGRGNLSLAWAGPPASGSPLNWTRLARLEGEPGEVPPGLAAESYRRLLTEGVARLPPPEGASRSSDEAAIVDAAARQLCFATAQGPTCNREFSYPSLVEGDDGSVHLFFTWHRARILHLQMPASWIEARLLEARP